MQSLIQPTDHWMIWTFLVSMAALSLILEQKFKIAQKITGAVIAIAIGITASSIGLMPTESLSYDIVWEYLIPLALCLLIIKMDVRAIFKETGRMAWVFHFAVVGTIVGTVVAYAILKDQIPQLNSIAPAMTASYIGGGINFVAMVATFDPPKDIVSATLVADSGMMAVYFVILMLLPTMKIIKKIFPRTPKSAARVSGESNISENYWKAKPISLTDIAKALAIAFIITTISIKISGFFGQDSMPGIIKTILGQKYLVISTLSLLFPLLFPKTSRSLAGNDEIATFFIFIFFVALGLPASIMQVVTNAPLMLLFCGIILFFNLLVTLVLGKIFKFEIEEIVIAGAVTSGGPMNGVAIAISRHWDKLIMPAMMLGVWGYLIGNYIGYAMGVWLGL